MENSSPSMKHPVVPLNEKKCVWMTAGILSYQLCDREFDCDHCPLDSAIRTFPQPSAMDQRQVATKLGATDTRTLLQGYLYSRKHCWIKSCEGNSVRVGIEPLLSSFLLNAKTVVLPSVGDHVQVNKVCAWVVLEGGTLPITSPVDGEVQRTNTALVDQPYGIHDGPIERGWLFELSTVEDIFNMSSLLRMAEADRCYAGDQQRFQSMVNAELKKHRAATGVTLADGGKIVQDVAAMLGAEKYFFLLKDAFA